MPTGEERVELWTKSNPDGWRLVGALTLEELRQGKKMQDGLMVARGYLSFSAMVRIGKDGDPPPAG